MKASTAVHTFDDPFGLPAESLDRLSALAALALGDANNTEGISAGVLPLPRAASSRAVRSRLRLCSAHTPERRVRERPHTRRPRAGALRDVIVVPDLDRRRD